MLVEGPNFGINGSFSSPEKVKKTQNFAWVWIILLIIVNCLLMGKNDF